MKLSAPESLRLIREMIEVSHRRIKNDVILFIVWGWISFISCLSEYLPGVIIHTHRMKLIIKYGAIVLAVCGIVFTLIYILRQRKKATTYISISLRYVWISLVISMILINLIQFNVLHKINFELQHPLFMVMIAFAIVVTGGILRYRMIIAGGIIFALLAYVSSFLLLKDQLMVEAIAWLIAFIIPGHILYSQRNLKYDV